MSMFNSSLRPRINDLVKKGSISKAIQKVHQNIRFRISLLFRGRNGYLNEIKEIRKEFDQSRLDYNYTRSAVSIANLLNLTDKLDRTRSNLALIWIPISFVLLSLAGYYIPELFKGEPELFDCDGSTEQSCAVLFAPFGGATNDIDQALYKIFESNSKDWYSLHNLSTTHEEGDKYSFLENSVYPSCQPKIMIYGQGNIGADGMDVDIRFYSLDFPIKDSLDLEEAEFFQVPSFSEKYIKEEVSNSGLQLAVESYLLRVCDRPMNEVKMNVEMASREIDNPELKIFSFQNTAETFAKNGDFKNAEILLSQAISIDKRTFDSYAMRGMMKDRVGEDYLGAYSDYSTYLKFVALNHTVRMRRFRSVESHYKLHKSLTKNLQTEIVNQLKGDLRKLDSQEGPEFEKYKRDVRQFLADIEKNPPEKEFVLTGQIKNYQRLMEAELGVFVRRTPFEQIRDDGSFEIRTTNPEEYINSLIEMHADDFISNRWQIKLSSFNTVGPLTFELMPKENQRVTNTVDIEICPYLQGISTTVLFSEAGRDKEVYSKALFAIKYSENIDFNIELEGNPIKFEIEEKDATHWNLRLVSDAFKFKPYSNNEFLAGKKSFSLYVIKKELRDHRMDFRKLSTGLVPQAELGEKYPLSWDRRARAYRHKDLSLAKICEIQQNKWALYLVELAENGEANSAIVSFKNFNLVTNEIRVDF